jgi:hypothetical protein
VQVGRVEDRKAEVFGARGKGSGREQRQDGQQRAESHWGPRRYTRAETAVNAGSKIALRAREPGVEADV